MRRRGTRPSIELCLNRDKFLMQNPVHTTHHGFLRPDHCIRSIMLQAAQEVSAIDSGFMQTINLLKQLKETDFPQIEASHHSRLAVECHAISFKNASIQRYNIAVRIRMPCTENSLLWMPWLPHQTQPTRSPGEYQHANFGRYVLMPRRSKCYGVPYHFSAQIHPLEPTTPAEINALYKETSAIFNLDAETVPNMCLENDYDCGRHYMSEHSDDDRQFGELQQDVYSWVTGAASRVGVFRVRSVGKKRLAGEDFASLCCDPLNPVATRDLVEIGFPAGLYAMVGPNFQKRYSHEFPQAKEKLFKRILKVAPELWKDDYPEHVESTEKGASQTTLVQAAWLKENREKVRRAAEEGRFAIRGKPVYADLSDAAAFDEWCLGRTSYTLRRFADVSGAVVQAKVKKRKLDD
ncbi:hypothetical protein HDU81_003467 [Chytriomyces hyalinus]|nr:hypothetical protein HDU81_003467 [Chytriomyces hyalinus]